MACRAAHRRLARSPTTPTRPAAAGYDYRNALDWSLPPIVAFMTDDITFVGHFQARRPMTIAAGQRHSDLPRQVRVLAAARAVNQLGAFSLAFLTVMMCRVLGASMATAGGVSALFGLATIPSRL